MKKIKQFAMKKIADDYILIPRYETAEEMSDVITLSETAAYIYQLVDQCETIAELTDIIILMPPLLQRTLKIPFISWLLPV